LIFLNSGSYNIMIKSKYRLFNLLYNTFLLLLAFPFTILFAYGSHDMIYDSNRPLLGVFIIIGGFFLVASYSAIKNMSGIYVDIELKIIKLHYF